MCVKVYTCASYVHRCPRRPEERQELLKLERQAVVGSLEQVLANERGSKFSQSQGLLLGPFKPSFINKG